MPRLLSVLATLTLLAACAPAAPTVEEASPPPSLLDTVTGARVIELNFIWGNDAPVLELNPPFRISLPSTHANTAPSMPGGLAFAGDVMETSGQHGAPTIDAIGHISHDGQLYGGVSATDSESDAGLTALGIENYPSDKFINRGVLLDVARYKGVDALDPGYEITPEDLEGTVAAQGVELRAGDSIVIRTGFGAFFEGDQARYTGFRPGVGEAGATWLAEQNPFLAGMDTLTFDVVPEAGTEFPAHRTLIPGAGVYLVENMNLEALGSELAGSPGEFALVINPLRYRGATASPLNAFALVE
ncbi:MAG: cyclase family protein [Vicinamibacterales bacterium]|jgi:kynurenine formamidase|nr:cyclase [Acidobacteriota bacterium]MDP6371358.1 cyclase family protein [Vicinamibacterales bacterium]MDP6608993.1 cyclase family protein [Vicinamibacterales bacterium]HAK56745.1 cyclase [Acidobacteriota bacterium]|tara:strand:+ start:794 stop:1696 length:903 start_codon:yes stop_codon:yes gene_type:complete